MGKLIFAILSERSNTIKFSNKFHSNFTRAEFPTILPHLYVDLVRQKNRVRPVDETALAILLGRLYYHHRIWKIQPILGVSGPKISCIINGVLKINLYYRTITEWHSLFYHKKKDIKYLIIVQFSLWLMSRLCLFWLKLHFKQCSYSIFCKPKIIERLSFTVIIHAEPFWFVQMISG